MRGQWHPEEYLARDAFETLQFLFRVRSDDVIPTPDEIEFVSWKWVDPDWLLDQVVEFRRDAYRTVLPRLLA